jgi:hypothetical protein
VLYGRTAEDSERGRLRSFIAPMRGGLRVSHDGKISGPAAAQTFQQICWSSVYSSMP